MSFKIETVTIITTTTVKKPYGDTGAFQPSKICGTINFQWGAFQKPDDTVWFLVIITNRMRNELQILNC